MSMPCIAPPTSTLQCSLWSRSASSGARGSTWRTKAKCRARAITCCGAWVRKKCCWYAARTAASRCCTTAARTAARASSASRLATLRQFRCPYHAWTYAARTAELVGVPLPEGYPEKPALGLGASAARRELPRLRVRLARGARPATRRISRRAGERVRQHARPRAGRHADTLRRRLLPGVPRQLEDVHGERGRPGAPELSCTAARWRRARARRHACSRRTRNAAGRRRCTSPTAWRRRSGTTCRCAPFRGGHVYMGGFYRKAG